MKVLPPIQQRDHRQVDGQIRRGLQYGSLETVRRNSATQRADCKGELIRRLPSALLCKAEGRRSPRVTSLPHS